MRGMPGTSAPMWFTISWNIMVWLHSSTASCRQYRYSGDPLGTQNAYSIRPRIKMDSKCRPVLATFACRHMPISIWRCPGCAWYQGFRPSGSVTGSFQRGSLSMTAYSGDSQSMSVYGLKLRRTDPSDSVVSISTYFGSSRTSMLRRQRRTSLVRAVFLAIPAWAIPSLPNEVYIWTRYVQRQYRRYRKLSRPLTATVAHP